MSRELKRVALDFEWPRNTVWKGYISPDVPACEACGGYGSTTAAQRLEDLMSLLMLSGEDARRGRCHPYLQEAPLYRTQGKVVSEDMAVLTEALAGRPMMGPLGHDSIDKWKATLKVIKAAGLPEDWGTCKNCDGDGVLPHHRKILDEFERTEPPTGPGYQMWETVSEGSPISPVFATAEELAKWLVQHPHGCDKDATFEDWMHLITGPGWSPSSIGYAGAVHNGVEGMRALDIQTKED